MWSLFRDGVLAIGDTRRLTTQRSKCRPAPLIIRHQPHAEVPQHNYPFDFSSRPEYQIVDVQRILSPALLFSLTSGDHTFGLLLQFSQQQTGEPPTKLTMEVLEPGFLATFLNYLEVERGICPHSRNVRLAAIHSFFRFVAFTEPSYLALAQRVLAMPSS